MNLNARHLLILASFPLLAIVESPAARAQTQKPASTQEIPAETQPGLTVSESVSDQIYHQTTATVTSNATSALTIDSSLRIFFPRQLELANNYFEVDYAANTKSVPGFVVGPHLPLAVSQSGAKLSSFFNLGYAYSQGIYDAESDSGLAVEDAVELQWIPLQAGLDAATRPFTSQGMVFGLATSVGVDWLTQSGELDGMSQTFWVPRYEAGPSLTLFSNTAASRGGFGGIRLGALYYSSFATPQRSRGVAADLGARYAF